VNRINSKNGESIPDSFANETQVGPKIKIKINIDNMTPVIPLDIVFLIIFLGSNGIDSLNVVIIKI